VTFDLFTRDAAFRSLPMWILVSAIIASALEGMRTFLAQTAARGGLSALPDSLLLVVVFWLPLAIYLTFGRTNLRCSRFDLTLPVPARRLWWIHLTAVASSGVVLLMIVALVVRLRDGLFARLSDRVIVPDSDVAALAPALVACLLLAVALLQAFEPTVYRIPPRRHAVLFSVLGAVLMLGLLAALAALPNVFSLFALALAGWVGWRGARAVPASFTLLPRQPEGATAKVRQGAISSGLGWAGALPDRRGTLARHLSVTTTAFGILSRGIAPGAVSKIPTNLSQLPMMFGWGLLFAGTFFGGPDIWLFFVVITVYLLLAFLAGPMGQLHLLDPLPISRHRIFAMLVLPGFLALVTGYGVGVLMTPTDRNAGPLVELTADRSPLAPHARLENPMVRVAVEYLAVATDGTLPSIESPWGESHEPWSISVARGTGALLYSPFSTPEGSSEEFLALQLSRAIEATYGASLAVDEVGRRWLFTDASGNLGWNEEAFTTWLADEELLPRRIVPLTPFVLTLVGLMWLITVWIFLQSFRIKNSPASRKWAYFGLLGILLAVHLAVVIGGVGAVTRPWVAVGVSRLWVSRLAEVIPAGTAGVWLGGIVLFAIGYVWAQRRFEVIEVTAPRATQEG